MGKKITILLSDNKPLIPPFSLLTIFFKDVAYLFLYYNYRQRREGKVQMYFKSNINQMQVARI